MKKTLNAALKALIDRTLAPVALRVARAMPRETVLTELERRTARDCADYAQAHMAESLQFESKADLLAHALRESPPEGMLAEFGVWNGFSINRIAKLARPRIVFGFDSFEGLREPWRGWDQDRGAFSRGGHPPKVEANVRLVKGFFHETLPDFLNGSADPFAFLHVDCDTYEAAQAVLGAAGHRMVPGTVIVFDEYFGYRGWRLGEHKAWQECVARHGLAYDYLAFSAQSVAVRLRGTPR